MEKVREAVSKFLKDYRKKHNLTQEGLSKQLGYSSKTIANWEQCKSDMPVATVLKFREETGMLIDAIFGLEKEEDFDEISLNYTFDPANKHYIALKDRDISDEDELYDSTVDKMDVFLDGLFFEISNKFFIDNGKVEVSFEQNDDPFEDSIEQSNEFAYLIRNDHIEVKYVEVVADEDEKQLIPKYYISRNFLVYLIKRAINLVRWEEKNGKGSDLSKQLADVLEKLAERIENTQK